MAAFDLTSFKSSVLSNHLLRPNLFRVRIFAPPGLTNVAGGNAITAMLHDLELWGEATTLPLLSFTTSEMFRWGYGSLEKRPGIPAYQPWLVTFRMDGDGVLWRFFKEWQNLIVNNTNDLAGGGGTFNPGGASTNAARYELSYKEVYLQDIEVSIFDPSGRNVINVTMIEAFPYNIAEVGLNWAQNNEYMKFQVAFTFTDWVETTTSSAPDNTQVGVIA